MNQKIVPIFIQFMLFMTFLEGRSKQQGHAPQHLSVGIVTNYAQDFEYISYMGVFDVVNLSAK